MVAMNGYTTTPHHRQNRRRERPGSRTRRTITRKANIQYDCHEGLVDARDIEVLLPSDKTRPSPLLRQNFDQNWQRWKSREAEERTLAEIDKMQREEEQRRLFGGDVGDDELYHMGILYNEDDEYVGQDEDANAVSCDVPVEQSFPMFVLRHGKPRRSRRRSTWCSLPPLYFSASDLSDDADIKRLLSASILPIPTIQHREASVPQPVSISTDIPQSLPPPSAFESMYGSRSLVPICEEDNITSDCFVQLYEGDGTIPIPISISPTPAPTSLLHRLNQGDWTFIDIDDTAQHIHNDINISPIPCSEPETWILIDDS